MSGGESRLAVVRPSPLGVVPSWMVVGSTVAASMVMEAILVASAEAGLEVTLVIPPAPAMVEEMRETRLPALPGGGKHDSPSWSEL